jgi:diguanylate cyclase (GGDEF)-like protein
VAAWTLGGAVVLIGTGRMAPVRLIFNVLQFALVSAIACGVFGALAGPGSSLPVVWAAVTLAVLVASTASVALIGVAMRLSGMRISPRKQLELVTMAWFVAGTNAALGAAVAAVLEADPWAVVLLLPAAGALFIAYRAYTAERAKHTSLEFLFDASRALARASDSTRGLAGLLAMAVETFRAESAEICLFPAAEGEVGTRVAVHGDHSVETGQGVDPEVVAQLRALLARDASLILGPDDAGGALREHLSGQGVERAMLASLPGDHGALGAMLVADRVGVGEFGRDDLRLFETLARHTASMLGQDRLEQRVRELRELSRHLEHQAFHDPLTGLANRLLFMDRVKHACSRRGGDVAVLYIDLDDFKWVNDNLGHDAGDELLVGVAERIRGALRAEDTPARLGGDEFAVLLIDISEEAHARVVAERLLRSLERPLRVGGRERTVHASLGVAMAPSGTLSGDEVVRNADVAMYVSKHGGKRGYSIYHSGMEGAKEAAAA